MRFCTSVGLVPGLEGDNHWFQFQLVLFSLELDLIFGPGCRTRTFLEKLDQELDSRFHLCVGLEPEQDLEPELEFIFLKNQKWNHNLSNLFLEQELRFLVRVKNCPTTLVYS